MSEERFDRLETRFDGLETRFDVLETRLDAVVADVAVLKTDVRDLKAGQVSMEERLTSKMLMLYEDTKATLRTMAEQYREVPGQLRELKEQMTGVTAQLTILIDSNRHFARVPDYHEHRITDLENRPGR
jgi:hypothetical protein